MGIVDCVKVATFLQKKYVSLPQYKKQSSDEVFSTELFLNYCAFTFVQ